MIQLAPPQSTAAEWRAFEGCCQRLSGFDDRLSYEYVDGFLAALASGPQPPEPAVWLAALTGDTFDRVFADPQDHAQALAALMARLRLLQRALDPEALFDAPEVLRLEPYVMEWTDEDRQLLRDSGVPEEELAEIEIGLAWAEGFLAAVQGLPPLWPEPPDEESAKLVEQALAQVRALTLAPAGEAMQAHLAAYYPDRSETEPVTRDDLLAEACMSVQDLRMFCVDFAPVPTTRRVEPTPGRNDPCPCGSGKKFKKCHGAQA